jgi:hypothetical protein
MRTTRLEWPIAGGVLVILALLGQLLADAAVLDGVDDFLARTGIWAAAVLFPAGFFLSSAGRGRTEPNHLTFFSMRASRASPSGSSHWGSGCSWRSTYLQENENT